MSAPFKRSRTGFEGFGPVKYENHFHDVTPAFPKLRGDTQLLDRLMDEFCETVIFNADHIISFFMAEIRNRASKSNSGSGFTEEVSKCKEGFLTRITTSTELDPPLPVNEFYGFGNNKKQAKVRAVAACIGACRDIDDKVGKQSCIETIHRLKASKKFEWRTQTDIKPSEPDYYEEIIVPAGALNGRPTDPPFTIRITGGRQNLVELIKATITLCKRAEPKNLVPLVHPHEDYHKGSGATFNSNKRLTPNWGPETTQIATDDEVEKFLFGVNGTNLSPDVSSTKGQCSVYTQQLNQFAQKSGYTREVLFCISVCPETKQPLHYCRINLFRNHETRSTAACAMSKPKASGQASLLMLKLLSVQPSDLLDEIASSSIQDMRSRFETGFCGPSETVGMKHIGGFINTYVTNLSEYDKFDSVLDKWIAKNMDTVTNGNLFPVDGDLRALWARAVCFGPEVPITKDGELFLTQLIHKVFERYNEIKNAIPTISVEDWEDLLDLAVYSWGNDPTKPGFIKYFERGESPFIVDPSKLLSTGALIYYHKYRYLMAIEAASCLTTETIERSTSDTAKLYNIHVQSTERILANVSFPESVCFYGDDDALLRIDENCPIFEYISDENRQLCMYPTYVAVGKATREGATDYRLSMRIIGDTGHCNGLIPYVVLCQQHKIEPRITFKLSTSMSAISNSRMKEALHELTFLPTTSQLEKVKRRSYNYKQEIRDTILWSGQWSGLFPHFPASLCHGNCSISNGLEVPFGCNDDQISAIEKSIQLSFSLIWGPPGTGKTRVSAMIMITWLRHFLKIHNKRVKILAVAGTNMGARNLYEVAIEYIPPSEHKVMFVTHNDAFIHNANPQQFAHEVRSADVVVTTCIHIGSPLYAGINFDFCLIDEAGQSLEPSVLVPIGKGVDRVVLVGDYMQLPPLIRSQFAMHNGLGVSLQERLMSNGAQCVLLRTQYRMHPSICHWPNYTFYGGYLVDGPVTRSVAVIKNIPKHDANSRVLVVDCNDGREEDHNKSKYNDSEIDAIYKFINHLSRFRVIVHRDIGIISPYTAQISRLKKRLSSFREIEIASVDGFQGREKELIILSLVRSNEQGILGFLHDDRRMNVQLTRARRGLIIFCHKQTLLNSRAKTNSTHADWIHWMEEQDLIMNKDKFIQELECHKCSSVRKIYVK